MEGRPLEIGDGAHGPVKWGCSSFLLQSFHSLFLPIHLFSHDFSSVIISWHRKTGPNGQNISIFFSFLFLPFLGDSHASLPSPFFLLPLFFFLSVFPSSPLFVHRIKNAHSNARMQRAGAARRGPYRLAGARRPQSPPCRPAPATAAAAARRRRPPPGAPT